jgi:hypothetical protein
MPKYRETFRKRHTLIAVVHVEDGLQALQNVRIAEENGADGAFLINHSIRTFDLIQIYAILRKHFPTFWMGMNMLGLEPKDALSHMPDNDAGLWVDNAGVRESGSSPKAEEFTDYRTRQSSWRGIYFGGVAFKYQEPVRDVAKAAKAAMPYVDVITTSGAGTGSAADPKKIKKMKDAIGNHPLAIASGVTPENVHLYPDADCFLVATGISDSHTELNPKRVAKLAKLLQ